MITETTRTSEAIEPKALKAAVRKFWGTRPCGVAHSSRPADSHGFFEETEKHRFEVHTDWDRPFLKEAIRFSEHTGKFVLEIGCGIGVDALEWSRAGNRMVCVDYNLPSVEITRARFQDAGASGTFINDDAENLPFADNTFDLIYSFGVLHHTPGTEKAIQEVYRCLKPGGQAIIMLYYKWSAMTLGAILLGNGIRQGGLWKTKSIADLISRYTEWDSQTSDNICPLTKVYSKRQARKMFRQFRGIHMELHYLWPGHFGPLRRLLPLVPEATKRQLHKRFGWNLIIRGSK
ncbi:MAG: class I SAM-dependent methyltransferase [Candidatus Acidiferrales bacterium]